MNDSTPNAWNPQSNIIPREMVDVLGRPSIQCIFNFERALFVIDEHLFLCFFFYFVYFSSGWWKHTNLSLLANDCPF